MKLTTPVTWIGGKVRLRDKIIPYFDRAKYRLYVEPFSGTGGMFFGRPYRKEIGEVINDTNKLIVNFFTVLRSQEKTRLLQELCAITPHSRVIWYQFKDILRSYLNGEEGVSEQYAREYGWGDYDYSVVLALALFYNSTNGYCAEFLDAYGGGVVPGQSGFHDPVKGYRNKVESLMEYTKRLGWVVIENLDFADCLYRYDSMETLFYCDPPYECPSGTNKYKSGWTTADSERLVEALLKRHGSVVLSCYDNPVYEKLLENGYQRDSFELPQIVCPDPDKRVKVIETIYYKLREKAPKKTLFDFTADEADVQ